MVTPNSDVTNTAGSASHPLSLSRNVTRETYSSHRLSSNSRQDVNALPESKTECTLPAIVNEVDRS
eukprot:42522-Eustigmatos_ZCMA.PRE.1